MYVFVQRNANQLLKFNPPTVLLFKCLMTLLNIFQSRLAKLTEAVNSHSRSNKEPQRYRMDSDVTAEIKQVCCCKK